MPESCLGPALRVRHLEVGVGLVLPSLCRHAVLQHMAHTIGCRGMFSTHYHALADEHAADPQVRAGKLLPGLPLPQHV